MELIPLSTASLPLDQLPGVDLSIPRIQLGSWPTPVEPAIGLGRPGRSEIWIKREDKASALYGGNKVRKLEYLLAGSAGPVLTAGGLGSHHVLATALHARALGRECSAVLVPQPLTPHTRAVLDLNLGACTEVVRLDQVPDDPCGVGRAATSAAAELALRRGATLIAPGGSTPAGALGYVNAGLELADQVADGSCPRPDRIYVPLGSGGTTAGLALGLALAGLDTTVVAVRVANLLTGNERYVRLLARLAHARLRRAGLRTAMPRLRVRVVHRAVGEGYGHPTAEGQAAVERAAGANLPCETTYTGKALAVLLEEAAADPAGGVRMFLDTYGPIDQLGRPRERSTEERS